MYRVQRESAPIAGVGRIVNPRFKVVKTLQEAQDTIKRIETFQGHSYAHGKPTFSIHETRR